MQQAIYDINDSINNNCYNIEEYTLIKGHNIAHTIEIIKEGINYKRRKYFDIEYIYGLWLQIFTKI